MYECLVWLVNGRYEAGTAQNKQYYIQVFVLCSMIVAFYIYAFQAAFKLQPAQEVKKPNPIVRRKDER